MLCPKLFHSYKLDEHKKIIIILLKLTHSRKKIWNCSSWWRYDNSRLVGSSRITDSVKCKWALVKTDNTGNKWVCGSSDSKWGWSWPWSYTKILEWNKSDKFMWKLEKIENTWSHRQSKARTFFNYKWCPNSIYVGAMLHRITHFTGII